MSRERSSVQGAGYPLSPGTSRHVRKEKQNASEKEMAASEKAKNQGTWIKIEDAEEEDANSRPANNVDVDGHTKLGDRPSSVTNSPAVPFPGEGRDKSDMKAGQRNKTNPPQHRLLPRDPLARHFSDQSSLPASAPTSSLAMLGDVTSAPPAELSKGDSQSEDPISSPDPFSIEAYDREVDEFLSWNELEPLPKRTMYPPQSRKLDPEPERTPKPLPTAEDDQREYKEWMKDLIDELIAYLAALVHPDFTLRSWDLGQEAMRERIEDKIETVIALMGPTKYEKKMPLLRGIVLNHLHDKGIMAEAAEDHLNDLLVRNVTKSPNHA